MIGLHRTSLCICDPGWKGEDCGQADLLPFAGTGYINKSAASWGGRPVHAGGKWHLFATEIAHRCPLILFMNDSSVVRAEADSPVGPYVHKETVLPPFHHNPTTIGPTPDGYYLIYSIGNTNTEVEQIPCEQAVPADCDRENSFCRGTHMPNSNGRINLAYSKSVLGPWTEKVILPYDADGNASAWNCENNNPTATILSNGTIFLVYRADPCKASAGGGAGGGESLGVAIAAHWSGPYIRRAGAPIVSPSDGTGNHEDPFLFEHSARRDGTKSFHIITHNQAAGNVCGNASDHGCGAHIFSRDGWTWTISRTPVYDVDIELSNGSTSVLQTRQRPQILFSASGQPQVLTNGASFEGNNPDMAHLTHTFAFAFRQ
jgi:hypothetical protein